MQKDIAMKRRTRLTVACLCAFVLCAVTISAQNAQPKEQYTIKVMPPGYALRQLKGAYCPLFLPLVSFQLSPSAST